MNGTLVIPGPEILVLFGIQVPVLSAIFGIGGVLLGHLCAPVTAERLGWRRHVGVVIAGIAVSLALTIATGQRPLLILGWSIGIGFAGVALFASFAAQVQAATSRLFETLIESAAARISSRKDDGK